MGPCEQVLAETTSLRVAGSAGSIVKSSYPCVNAIPIYRAPLPAPAHVHRGGNWAKNLFCGWRMKVAVRKDLGQGENASGTCEAVHHGQHNRFLRTGRGSGDCTACKKDCPARTYAIVAVGFARDSWGL